MSDGLGSRVIDEPRVGWFLVERAYGPDEVKPRLVKDREFVCASIYEEAQPDETVILLAEIDGRAVDPMDLWIMRLWPLSEAEYLDRRRSK